MLLFLKGSSQELNQKTASWSQVGVSIKDSCRRKVQNITSPHVKKSQEK